MLALDRPGTSAPVAPPTTDRRRRLPPPPRRAPPHRRPTPRRRRGPLPRPPSRRRSRPASCSARHRAVRRRRRHRLSPRRGRSRSRHATSTPDLRRGRAHETAARSGRPGRSTSLTSSSRFRGRRRRRRAGLRPPRHRDGVHRRLRPPSGATQRGGRAVAGRGVRAWSGSTGTGPRTGTTPGPSGRAGTYTLVTARRSGRRHRAGLRRARARLDQADPDVVAEYRVPLDQLAPRLCLFTEAGC